jgi:general nucleoside transport system permease protein
MTAAVVTVRGAPRQRGAMVTALLPLAAAIAVGSLVVAWAGASPVEFFRLLGREAFSGVDRLSATFASATPLIITGLATLIAFKAGVFNIGVEGSFIAGAFTAAIVGANIDLPGPVQIVLAIAAAMAVGAAVGWGPGWLKARLGVDEVVVTLMGNFVVAGVVSWLLADYFLAQGTGNAASEMVAAQTRLPSLVDGTQLTVAFLIALVLVIVTQLWLSRTTFGFELRMVGANPRFARAQGIDIARIVIVSMIISGALGGLAGSTFTLGTLGRFVDGAGANLGFNGIAVALLGRLNPFGALLAAIALGALAAAGPTVQLFIDVPLDVIRIMQGTILITAVIPLVRRRT